MNEKQKANSKVMQELSDYRELVISKKGQEIYQSATEIMLTEACASYVSLLLECEITDFPEKVLHEYASLSKCVSEVVSIANFLGDMGEIMIDDFYKAIIDYYNLDHKEIHEKEARIKEAAVERAQYQKRMIQKANSSLSNQKNTKKNTKNSTIHTPNIVELQQTLWRDEK